MKKMKKVLLFLTLFFTGYSFSQTFIMDGPISQQSFITCSGKFMDAGGDDGDPELQVNFYPNNVVDTIVFCPDQDGKKIRFIVEQFLMQTGDLIEVYDGSFASFSNLIGTYTKPNEADPLNLLPGDTIQASSFNPTGCLTIIFKSNNDNKTDAGWVFNISCFVPCQDIVGSGTFNGISAEDSIFQLCRGDVIDFLGFGIYPDMGTPKQLYFQSNALSTFTWTIEGPNGSSNTETGTYNALTGFSEASHTFADSGIFHITLEIQDTLTEFECKNRNYVHNIVYVSGPPIFLSPNASTTDTTRPIMPILCLGDTNYLIGIVDTFFHVDNCEPSSGDIKLIPDGTEAGGLNTIELEIEFKCYGKEIIDDADDITSICLDIEHSAVGDLDVQLICPSGNTVRLIEPNVFNNANLGTPLLTGSAMGETDTYCFTRNGDQSINEASTGLGTNSKVSTAPALPLDSLSNLIGCRINGKWKILIKDTRINDNGYAGNATITFHPSIQPASDSVFYNVYLDSNWMEEPGNPSTAINFTPLTKGDTVGLLPTAIGTYNYKFEVLDDFGCTYDTVVTFQVVERKQADFTYVGPTVFCENEPATINPVFLEGYMGIMGEAGEFEVTPTGLNVNPTTGVITIAGSEPGTYVITNTVTTPITGCVDIHTFSGTITINPLPEPTIVGAGTYCQLDTLTILPGATDSAYVTYLWTNGSTIDSAFVSDASNPITVTVTDINGCEGTSDPVTVTGLAQAQHDETITVCEGGSALIHGIVRTVPGVYSQIFSTGQTTCDSVSNVTLQFFPRVNLGPDATICEGSSTTLTAGGIDPFNANYTWTNGVFGQTQEVNPIINTEYIVIATDGNGCVTRDSITVFVNPIRNIGLSVPGSTVCVNSPAPVPVFTAFPGYSFTVSPFNFNFDVNTGIITTGTAGIYTITYTDGAYACDINNTATITVTDSPDATFSYGTLCVPGTTASPVFNGTASAGVFTYTNPNFGLALNPVNGVIDLTVSNAGSYFVTNFIAASGACPEVSFTTEINVHDRPTLSIDPNYNNNFCVGGSTTLTAQTVTSVGDVSFNWSPAPAGPNGVSFAPPSSQTYTVTGTDVTGCTNTGIAAVIVNQLPVINPITPSTICLGESATITAFSPNQLTQSISYAWDNGLGSGASHVVSPTSTTTYTVTVRNTTTFCDNTASTTVTVNQPTINADDLAICIGQTATITASGALNYTWTNMNNGATVGSTSSITQNPTITTVYRVRGLDANGCTFEDLMTLTVNPLPNITAVAVPTNVCSGTPTTITANGGSTYFLNGNNFNSGNTTTYVPSNGGTTSVSENLIITGTDNNNCTNTFTVPITVHPLPIVDAGSDQVVCAGQSVTLFSSSTSNISWSDGVVNGVSFVPTSSGTYTVTGTDANGCQGTDVVSIVVNQLPNVQANASDITLCEGQVLTLTGSGADEYFWNNGVVNGTPFNVSPTTSVFVVTGRNATTGCSNTDEIIITVNPNPQVVAIANESQICEGNSVILSATGSFSVYNWSTGQNEQTFTDSPAATTTYIVNIVDANGCSANGSVTVNVVPNNVVAGISADSTQGYPGLTVDFTNTSQNANSYVWTFGNGNPDVSTGSNGPQNNILYSNEGDYPVTLVATNTTNGCRDEITIIIKVVPFDGAIVCPPNIFTPNGDGDNDNFFVPVCGGIAAEMSVIVYNRWGNQIHEITGLYDPNDNKTFWDGTSKGNPVSEGVYFYTYKVVGKNGDIAEGHDNVMVVRDKK
jgi:gliding motility-associated-like protein